MQTTSHLLMIRPVGFAFNTETATNNAFQSASDSNAQESALAEFDSFVELLRRQGIDVTVIDDTKEPHTPDSIFPNNWISFHDDGSVVFYPMFARNRRLERKPHVVEKLGAHFQIDRKIDLSPFEQDNAYLEGTGSMVLDRTNRIAYACISTRTDIDVLNTFCLKLNFTAKVFSAVDAHAFPIYHTNVMMCVADQYVVICLESMPDDIERNEIINTIKKTGKEVVPISLKQMNHFAGNMLQVENTSGQKFLIMSTQAYNSLIPSQVAKLGEYNAILHSSLDTIERNGGGSARCMMAEIFLPEKETGNHGGLSP